MPELSPSELAERIKAKAKELGFDLVGITGAEPSAFAEEYRDWIAQGYAGEMDYLARNLERRLDPRELLPDARSIIVVGMNYYNPSLAPPTTAEESTDSIPLQHDRATFARYALGEDYHDVITARLKQLWAFIQTWVNRDEVNGKEIEEIETRERDKRERDRREIKREEQMRIYVDAGPILEREVARRAGLGWFGKNTMLINTRRGSYFFLGEIVTTLALPSDHPAIGGCGTCTRCIDACPTDAIVEPYKVDARRCLSYLTIELKGAIPEEFRPALAEAGNRIYGCDICQEVCPFNRGPEASHPTLVPTDEKAFQPREITSHPKLTDLLMLSEEEFREKFKGSPVKRAKRRGLLRNVAVALSQSDEPEARATLQKATENDPEPLVREHAAWSLQRIQPPNRQVAKS